MHMTERIYGFWLPLWYLQTILTHSLTHSLTHWYDTSSFTLYKWPSWSWSDGSWIYNNLCNHFIPLLTLWLRIQLMTGVPDSTVCDKVCQWLVTGRWFSLGFIHTKIWPPRYNWNSVESDIKHQHHFNV